MFMVGSVCRVKRFTARSRNSLKGVQKSHTMPDRVRKSLRQQSKDFYASGFHTSVKRWDKCISVAGYVEKRFFSGSNIMFYALFFTYLLTLPCIKMDL
jgi:hypothetical protein